MLEQLLSELRSGSTTRVDELAIRLNTTPAMVQAMLDHLVNLNLVNRYQSCDDSCSACSVKDLCNDDPQGRVGLYYLKTK